MLWGSILAVWGTAALVASTAKSLDIHSVSRLLSSILWRWCDKLHLHQQLLILSVRQCAFQHDSVLQLVATHTCL